MQGEGGGNGRRGVLRRTNYSGVLSGELRDGTYIACCYRADQYREYTSISRLDVNNHACSSNVTSAPEPEWSTAKPLLYRAAQTLTLVRRNPNLQWDSGVNATMTKLVSFQAVDDRFFLAGIQNEIPDARFPPPRRNSNIGSTKCKRDSDPPSALLLSLQRLFIIPIQRRYPNKASAPTHTAKVFVPRHLAC